MKTINFKQKLAKYGYNIGNCVPVETLIDEILPEIFNKKPSTADVKQTVLTMLWSFCEKEFNADFEGDWINGYGSKTGMSERAEKFAERVAKKLIDLEYK